MLNCTAYLFILLNEKNGSITFNVNNAEICNLTNNTVSQKLLLTLGTRLSIRCPSNRNLAEFEWKTERSFSYTYSETRYQESQISQGSAATYFRCVGSSWDSVVVCTSALFGDWIARSLASLDRHAQPTRCFSAVAQLLFCLTVYIIYSTYCIQRCI